MSWTPESDESSWSPEGECSSTVPPAPSETEILLDVRTPMRLQLERYRDERLRPGFVGLVTRRADCPAHAPIARMAVTEAVAESLLASDLFDAPLPLRLHAALTPEGLHGTLDALVPIAAAARWMHARELAAEPWRASLDEAEPALDPAAEEASDVDTRVPLQLGTIWRFADDFRHEGNIVLEAADLLMSLLGGHAVDADQRRVDQLLASL